MDNIEKKIIDIIDSNKEKIISFGRDIWHHAELGYKEFRTAEKFKNFLEELGIEPETGLAVTGVKGYLREKGSESGPTIALMGELDALPISSNKDANPETGASHCCGHNAQITAVLGAALALTNPEIKETLGGNIVFFAAPAEEFVDVEYRTELRKKNIARYGGGKCELIRTGAMDDIDLTVGHHASTDGGISSRNSSNNGVVSKLVTYYGKSSHAAGAPHEGIDALAAANIAMVAINSQRELFREADTVRIHGFISKGGEAANVIADNVSMEYLIRAANIEALKDADAKVNRAFKAGAVATGCGLSIDTVPGYMPVIPFNDISDVNDVVDMFAENYKISKRTGHGTASTDFGDVSTIMPVLQFGTGGYSGILHNSDVSVTDEYLAYVVPAKIFALIAYRLMRNDAKRASELISGYTPKMTKAEYLNYMESMMSLEEIPQSPLPLLH